MRACRVHSSRLRCRAAWATLQLQRQPHRRQHTSSSAAAAVDSAAGNTAAAVTTSSVATTTAASLTSDELDKLARLVENDPRILMEVVARLEPQNRRRLIVAGGAMEWFGKESAAQEVERADVDKDRSISPKDFDHWFASALKQRGEHARRRGGGSGGLAAATLSGGSASSSSSSNNVVATPSADAVSPTTTTTTTATATVVATAAPVAATTVAAAVVPSPANATTTTTSTTTSAASHESDVPLSGLMLVAVQAGLPFVGFGFLDNATMIVAGDLIDSTLGFYLNCSILASAAMGNVCSGVFGMQVHGLIDKAMRRLFRHLPVLTPAQLTNRRVFFAGHLGGTLGIALGLLLGMCPLLFLREDANEKSDYAMFRRWDSGKSGYIELPELEHVLAALGVCQTHDTATRVMSKYGTDNKMSFEQYSRFKDDLRHGQPVFD